MKYVISRTGAVAIFPSFIEHSTIANQMINPIVAAGFVTIIDGKIRVGGESISTRKESREEDVEIIRKALANED